MTVICKPCKDQMEAIFKEYFDEIFWCASCGTEIEISYDKDLITVKQGKK